MPPPQPPTRRPVRYAINGPRPRQHSPPPRRPPPRAISMPPWPPRRKPKRWPRRRSSRLPARKSAGRIWKFAKPDGRGYDMTIRRRDLLKFVSAAVLSGGLPRIAHAADTASVYDLERFGNARILHMTDT